MTLVWCVGDIKVSHNYMFEVTNFSQYLLIIYGIKLKLYRENINDYLGMGLDYSEEGVVKVFII